MRKQSYGSHSYRERLCFCSACEHDISLLFNAVFSMRYLARWLEGAQHNLTFRPQAGYLGRLAKRIVSDLSYPSYPMSSPVPPDVLHNQ